MNSFIPGSRFTIHKSITKWLCYIRNGVIFMNEKKKQDTQKTATNNKWISTGLVRPNDKSDRRDGPGGENKD